MDFNAHYHNGALKCGSILKRWVKWFHYIFKMALKNDLCGIYTVGSYYGIRYVKESVFLLFLSCSLLLCILYSSLSLSAADQQNRLGASHLNTCSLSVANPMFKYTIRLSLEPYGKQKCFSYPQRSF